MSRICPLFSGSKANCTFISHSGAGILVDIGCSYRAFLKAISLHNIDIKSIKAVAITHEHSDHIGGLKLFLKENNVPVIASKKTLDALIDSSVIVENTKVIIAEKDDINVEDMLITRFATSHDCEGSSGYSVKFTDGNRISVCTDTGILTDDAKLNLLGSKAVILESNHDIGMLKNGPYPPYLKMRILSDKGHLSNNACAEFLPKLLNSGTDRFILGHISQNNNTPVLALKTSENALSLSGAKADYDYILKAANPNNNEVLAL